MTAYSMGMLETCRAMVPGARPEDLDDVLAWTATSNADGTC